MTFLLNLISGGIFGQLFSTIGNVFSTWTNTKFLTYQTGVTADTAIISKTIDAQIELNKIAAAQALSDKGWWVTAWMKPFVFYPFAGHAVGVCLDSMPLLGHKIGAWGIPPLPGAYAGMEETIILSVVGIVGLKGVARIFSKGM